MASIEIWEPTCQGIGGPCGSRANRIVRKADGEEVGKFCATHGNRAAQIVARQEKERKEVK